MVKRIVSLVLGLLIVLGPFCSGYQVAATGKAGPGERPSTDGCPGDPAASSWEIGWVETSKAFQDMRDNNLALDANGYPHIAYGGDHLYYASYDGTAWRLETVDPEEGVGTYASLALDAAGRPHIGYYDHVDDALKYASYDGTTWDIEVVDADDGMC